MWTLYHRRTYVPMKRIIFISQFDIMLRVVVIIVIITVAVVSLISTMTVSAQHGVPNDDDDDDVVQQQQQQPPPPPNDLYFHYDPSSEFGPQHWANLHNIENNQCGGMAQSGIDIVTTSSSSCDEYNIVYTFHPGTCTTKDLVFTSTDHVVRVDFNATACTPPSMIIPNIEHGIYDIVQYHIHSGSDHTMDGRYFGAEMHIVHQNRFYGSSRLAVLGLFIEPTNAIDSHLFDVLIDGIEEVVEQTWENCTAAGITDHRQRRTGIRDRTTVPEPSLLVYNPYDKVPPNSTMYFYSGSLTTPPCSEVVTWNVVDVPIRISVREYKTMIDLILNYVNPNTCQPASVSSPSGYTSRPTQPLNGRTVLRKCPYPAVEQPPHSRFISMVVHFLFGWL